MSRRALLVVVAALAFAPPAAAEPALRVQTSISPRPAFFGDPLTARVDVIVDASRVNPRSVRVAASFGPWDESQPTRIESTAAGGLAGRTYRFTLSCLDQACLPGAAPRVLALPPVRVTARARDGRALSLSRPWPGALVAARVPPSAAVAAKPPFRPQIELSAPTFRVGPGPLALALDVLAGVLAAAAAALVAAELVRRRRLQAAAADPRPPLVRAVALLREAETRPPDDRRKAANLVARTLRPDGDGLAIEASRVAWSAEQPSPDRLEKLAREIEHELEET